MRFPEAPGSHISHYRRGKFTVISIRKKARREPCFFLIFSAYFWQRAFSCSAVMAQPWAM